ncbi:hypothetical protein ES703_116712 [subsurface metagenome]
MPFNPNFSILPVTRINIIRFPDCCPVSTLYPYFIVFSHPMRRIYPPFDPVPTSYIYPVSLSNISIPSLQFPIIKSYSPYHIRLSHPYFISLFHISILRHPMRRIHPLFTPVSTFHPNSIRPCLPVGRIYPFFNISINPKSTFNPNSFSYILPISTTYPLRCINPHPISRILPVPLIYHMRRINPGLISLPMPFNIQMRRINPGFFCLRMRSIHPELPGFCI